MASTAVWIISPAAGARICAPSRRRSPALATSCTKPRVSKLARARGTWSRSRRRVSTAMPARAAAAGSRPALATCGSVKITAGRPVRSRRALPPVMLMAARVPAAAATYTNRGRLQQSPAAHTVGAEVRSVSSTTMAPWASVATPAAGRSRASVLGRRPVATSRASLSRVLPSSSCTWKRSPSWRTRSAWVCSRTAMPSAAKASRRPAPRAGSKRYSRVWRASRVTAAPSRRQAWASSTATMDEPSTIRCSGTVSAASASVEVQ